jgi:DNA-binding PucR family transcriptional regulator
VNRTLGQAFSLPDADREMLLTTARAWLAHGGSTSATAHELFLHRNTVRPR